MMKQSASLIRKVIGIASWICITPLFLMFIRDAKHLSVTLANFPLASVVVLTLLVSFAKSDLLVEILRCFKSTWRQWSDRRHFLTVGAVFLLLAVIDFKWILMMREYGMRIGQQMNIPLIAT